MTKGQEIIVKRAIRVRLEQGEDFYAILDGYTKMSKEDKEMLTAYFIEEGLAEPRQN